MTVCKPIGRFSGVQAIAIGIAGRHAEFTYLLDPVLLTIFAFAITVCLIWWNASFSLSCDRRAALRHAAKNVIWLLVALTAACVSLEYWLTEK